MLTRFSVAPPRITILDTKQYEKLFVACADLYKYARLRYLWGIQQFPAGVDSNSHLAVECLRGQYAFSFIVAIW